MKKCPFCAEEVQDDAIKCRFCGEFFIDSENYKLIKPKTKWYFTTSTIVIAILCVGPLALPLVWFHPDYKIVTKFIITAVVIALTIWLSFLTIGTYQKLTEEIKTLGM